MTHINRRHTRRSTKAQRAIRWYESAFGPCAQACLKADAQALAGSGHLAAASRLVAAAQVSARESARALPAPKGGR